MYMHTLLSFEQNSLGELDHHYLFVQLGGIHGNRHVHPLQVKKFSSHTLFDPAWVQKVNGGKPVMTQKAFADLLPKLNSPRECMCVCV